MEEQRIFMDFLGRNRQYGHWKPVFEVMLGTGLRVGEITGLRWEDLDFENGTISVNHTLGYYSHGQKGCYFGINTPKTKAGTCIVPMLDAVRNAFLQERKFQEELEVSCTVKVDGYTDFVFVNRFGNVQNQSTLNRALQRIIRDCNQDIIEKAKDKADIVLLPRFSCHTLRHTFATRLCEAGINMKVIQDVLGHADIGTTMNVYTDATSKLKQSEFSALSEYLDKNVNGGEEARKDMIIEVRTLGKEQKNV